MHGLKLPKYYPIWPPTVVPGRHVSYLLDPCGYLKNNKLFQMALDACFCTQRGSLQYTWILSDKCICNCKYFNYGLYFCQGLHNGICNKRAIQNKKLYDVVIDTLS